MIQEKNDQFVAGLGKDDAERNSADRAGIGHSKRGREPNQSGHSALTTLTASRVSYSRSAMQIQRLTFIGHAMIIPPFDLLRAGQGMKISRPPAHGRIAHQLTMRMLSPRPSRLTGSGNLPPDPDEWPGSRVVASKKTRRGQEYKSVWVRLPRMDIFERGPNWEMR
jgi:hypothetical protein